MIRRVQQYQASSMNRARWNEYKIESTVTRRRWTYSRGASNLRLRVFSFEVPEQIE
jgi:hypothetical protein